MGPDRLLSGQQREELEMAACTWVPATGSFCVSSNKSSGQPPCHYFFSAGRGGIASLSAYLTLFLRAALEMGGKWWAFPANSLLATGASCRGWPPGPIFFHAYIPGALSPSSLVLREATHAFFQANSEGIWGNGYTGDTSGDLLRPSTSVTS